MTKKFDFNPASGGQPKQVQLNLDPRDLDDVTCEKCGNFTFQAVLLMKRVPAVVAPEGKEAFWPTQMYACHACGHINSRFIAGVQWFSDDVLKARGLVPEQDVNEPLAESPDTIKGSALVLESVDK